MSPKLYRPENVPPFPSLGIYDAANFFFPSSKVDQPAASLSDYPDLFELCWPIGVPLFNTSTDMPLDYLFSDPVTGPPSSFVGDPSANNAMYVPVNSTSNTEIVVVLVEDETVDEQGGTSDHGNAWSENARSQVLYSEPYLF